MHVTNDQFSHKFKNGWKKLWKWQNCDFAHFTSIIWPNLNFKFNNGGRLLSSVLLLLLSLSFSKNNIVSLICYLILVVFIIIGVNKNITCLVAQGTLVTFSLLRRQCNMTEQIMYNLEMVKISWKNWIKKLSYML